MPRPHLGIRRYTAEVLPIKFHIAKIMPTGYPFPCIAY